MKLNFIFLYSLVLIVISCGTDELEEMVSTDETVVVVDDDSEIEDDGEMETADEESNMSALFPEFTILVSTPNPLLFKELKYDQPSQEFIEINLNEISGIDYEDMSHIYSRLGDCGIYNSAPTNEQGVYWIKNFDENSANSIDIPGLENSYTSHIGHNSEVVIKVNRDINLDFSEVQMIDLSSNEVFISPLDLLADESIRKFIVTNEKLILFTTIVGGNNSFLKIINLDSTLDFSTLSIPYGNANYLTGPIEFNSHLYYTGEDSNKTIYDVDLSNLEISIVGIGEDLSTFAVVDNDRIFDASNRELAIEEFDLFQINLSTGSKTVINSSTFLDDYVIENNIEQLRPNFAKFSPEQNVWVLQAFELASGSYISTVYFKISLSGEILSTKTTTPENGFINYFFVR